MSNVDRKAKLTILSLVPSNTANNLRAAILSSLKSIKSIALTITSDSSNDFSHYQLNSKELNADFSFAGPYSAWKGRVNKNTNGLVGQYFPNGRNLGKIALWEVKYVKYFLK